MSVPGHYRLLLHKGLYIRNDLSEASDEKIYTRYFNYKTQQGWGKIDHRQKNRRKTHEKEVH